MIANRIKDPENLVESYIDQVLTGSRSAGRLERFAVERYQLDVQSAADRGFFFDKKIARDCCLFFPNILRHSIGQWADEPFDLSPYQAFCVWNIQGWRSIEDKTRRFRKALITVARKNGKTTWGAGFANLLTYCDWPIEVNGRGYCAATKKPQAALLWSEVARMIRRSPSLSIRTKILGEDNASGGRVIVKSMPYNGSTIETIGSDALRQDGLNPSFVIKDELHAWRRGLIDLDEKLSTGGGARTQPLELIFTTAGDDNSEIWQDEFDFASRVLESSHVGDATDDSYFALVCMIDDDDSPLDPACWPKANPNLDISVRSKYLVDQAAEAALRPSKLRSFTRYHCNRKVGSYIQTYPPELWERGLVKNIIDPPPSALCYGGMDLGRADDWAAVTLVFPEQIEAEKNPRKRWRFKVMSRSWACKGIASASTDYTREPFASWIKNDLLEFQSDETLDFAPLKAWVVQMGRKYVLKRLAYDRTFAHEVAASLLNDYGISVVDYPQTYKAFTEPIKSLEKALLENRIETCDQVLTWQAMNCETVYDPRGMCMLDKGNAKRWRKIDAMVALLMAYSEAIYDGKKKSLGAGFVAPK